MVNNLHFTPAAMSAAACDEPSFAINSRHLANSKRQNISADNIDWLESGMHYLFPAVASSV